MPGVTWAQVREVANVVRATLDDFALVGWPKTSGSRGMHVNVRIEPRWTFDEVRRAALAFARVVEGKAPGLATSEWWKEKRHGVFLDYNQNAKDRTVASAYSVRPTPDARVSAPADVLVDAMRGRFSTWTRIRVNLRHIPEAQQPPQEALDPDERLGAGRHSHPRRAAPKTLSSS